MVKGCGTSPPSDSKNYYLASRNSRNYYLASRNYFLLCTIEIANAQDLAHALRTQRKFSNVRVAKHLQQKNSIHKKKAHLRMRPCAAHILNTKSDHEFP